MLRSNFKQEIFPAFSIDITFSVCYTLVKVKGGIEMTKEEMLKEVTFEVTQLRYELIQKGFNVFPIREVKLSTRCTRRFGLCTYHRDDYGEIIEVTITISDICFHSTKNCLRDVILHELCHAMPNGQGHREGFHNYARKVMRLYKDCHIDTYSTHEEAEKKNEYIKFIGRYREYKYKVTCNNCGHSYYYKNETKFVRQIRLGTRLTYHCGACKHKEFNLEIL